MNTRKFILREMRSIAIGEVLCVGAMWAVFALLGRFDYSVVLGGMTGGILAMANFFAMTVTAYAAGHSAVEQGKTLMKRSYRFRLLIMGVLLFLLAKSGHCNLLALVCPLFFTFPVIVVIAFFRKTGEARP